MSARVTLVYAVDVQLGIGYQGKLPWEGELPSDLKRFRALTIGHPIIMGRKTHESIGKPLDGRQNIVLSRQPDYVAEGCTVVGSLEQALALTAHEDEVFVIGGAALYEAAAPLADRLHRTEVSGIFEADTYFPSRRDFPAGMWTERVIVPAHPAEPPDQWGYRVVVEDRVRSRRNNPSEAGREMVDTTYAKDEQYHRILREILDAGVCPFCAEHFNWHPNPILREEDGWLITRSMQPYENTAEHFLLIRRDHVEQLYELDDHDWLTLGRLCRWAARKFKLDGGGIALRWGDPKHTGATVRHLHAHLIVPELDPNTGRAKTVSFPIG